MEQDSAGISNKTRFLDLPIVRMAIQKYQEVYGAQSEVFLNFMTVILVSIPYIFIKRKHLGCCFC